MLDNKFEFKIRVKGRGIDEYSHEGNAFVEGRKGSEFDLMFRNGSGDRVLVVPSVDGLSPLTGDTAGPDSRGYVVEPFQTLIIPGWTLDQNQVSKFLFADKERSYAASQGEEQAANAGVVGVLVYGEKAKPQPPITIKPYPAHPLPRYPYDPYWEYPRTWLSGVPHSASPLRSINTSSTTATLSASASTTKAPSEEADFSLGTAWGDRQDFRTQEVEFKRDGVKAQMLIYYDSRRNLEKRGIVVKPEKAVQALPQAFSGVGCKPPQGWKG